MLAHLLGPLQPPNAAGETLTFDQRPFVDGKAIDAGLADEAYVHVPQDCRHARLAGYMSSFHGCRQSAANVGRRFVDGAGYNRWADSNRIIVLYPQTVPRLGLAIRVVAVAEQPLRLLGLVGLLGQRLPHARRARQIKPPYAR
jgi:poly(3-hydroxybutyrate) depolymerase